MEEVAVDAAATGLAVDATAKAVMSMATTTDTTTDASSVDAAVNAAVDASAPGVVEVKAVASDTTSYKLKHVTIK